MARVVLAVAAVVSMLALIAAPAAGQLGPGGAALSCTASLVTSFAPCVNFITNNSASPTADCCRSLGALVKSSANCACLILTGSVPLGVPVNRSLAVTMPKACNTSAVPLVCQDPTTAALTPAPGPVAEVAPSLAPLPAPMTPTTPVPTEEAPAPAPPVDPIATPPVSQGQSKPAVMPNSAWRKSSPVSVTAAFVLLLAFGGALV